MADRYAKFEHLKFDRPHPRVLRVTGTLEMVGFTGPEGSEGMSAFLEKRPVIFNPETKV